jgi:hypothetical protein
MTATLMLYGFIVAEQLVIALFFFRFWRQTHDPLFAFFTAGFLVMAVHRTVLGWAVATGIQLEQQTPFFLVRLLSYGLILAGVVMKNRQRRRMR